MSVEFAVEGPVAFVTLNRPERLNAIDPETHQALVDAWVRFAKEPELRCAVLTGKGPRSFSAGIDVRRLDDFYRESRPGERLERWLREPGLGGITRNLDPGKPILAAIDGFCLGGGLELALACDLRLATPRSTFGLPEVRWGIIPGQGGTQRLPRTVPAAIALEMVLTGRPISARRALEVGLVNRVVPPGALHAEALALAREISSLPEEAVRRARRALREGIDLPLSVALQFEQRLADPLRQAGKFPAPTSGPPRPGPATSRRKRLGLAGRRTK